jgi:signal transduction histidine kinase/ligand-binding sensor domain-containing protein
LELEQTPDGYLWLGTTHGLARFDGVRFEGYLDTRLPHRFGTRVEGLDVDSAGRLWIVAEQEGLLAFHHRQFTEYHTNGAVLNHPTASVCSDPAGWVWVVDARGRLARMTAADPTQIEPVDFKLAAGARLLRDGKGNIWANAPRTISGIITGNWVTVLQPQSEILAAGACRDDGLWLATEGQLHRLNSVGNLAALATFPWPPGATRVTCLYEDRQGVVWVGTSSQGLFQWVSGQFKQVMAVPRAINCLAQDQEGNLWAGTRGGGLARIRKRIFHVVDSRSGLRNEYINSIVEDHEGRMWLATEENGLGRIEGGRWQPLGRDQGWGGQNVFCFAPARHDGLWLATAAQGLWRWQSNRFTRLMLKPKLPPSPPRCLHEGQDGTLWLVLDDVALFSVAKGTFQRHGMRNGLNTRRVRAIAEDAEGGIWAGDWHGGVWRFNGKRWQEIRGPTSSAEAARTLTFDARGTLWMGTAGAGLLRLQAEEVASIGRQQGLPSANIEQMLLHEDSLWLGTDKGLFRASLEQLHEVANGRRAQIEVIRHGQSDGLPDLHFTGRYQPRNWRTRDGELWFATANGAVYFQPIELTTNGPPPQALLEGVLVNGQPQPPATTLHLHSDARRLEFRFTAPSFGAPERVRFRYQLTGVDETWVECGSNRSATYASVPFGRHVFRVAAGTIAGVWGPASEQVSLVMQPYFWQTQWFIAAVAAVLAGGLAWSARRATLRRLNRKLKLLEQQHALERERARISQDIHDELGANLTTIGLLADMGVRHKANPDALTRDLTKISETARGAASAMDAIVWAVNPRNDSLDHFANYIGQFTKDFFRPTPVRIRLDLPTALPAHPMSAQVRHDLFLAMKEALNNVARHAEATEIRLGLQAVDNTVRLTVEDNGKGMPAGLLAEGQDGLTNMRSRIENIGGVFAIEPLSGGGTRLVFSVPLPKLKPD